MKHDGLKLNREAKTIGHRKKATMTVVLIRLQDGAFKTGSYGNTSKRVTAAKKLESDIYQIVKSIEFKHVDPGPDK